MYTQDENEAKELLFHGRLGFSSGMKVIEAIREKRRKADQF
jgi:hypothetical protein